MTGSSEAAITRVRAAAARTYAAGTARLSFGWRTTAADWDRLGEGVTDFATRRAHVTQRLVPERIQGNNLPEALTRPKEMVYDGARTFIRVNDTWAGFATEEVDGPRSTADPVWPLDALFGAGTDAVELGEQTIRDVVTTGYRLTVDLVAADAALLAGIGVPEGPFRQLRTLPAEVWLDEAGLARHIEVRKPGRISSEGDQNTSVVEFWDFGVTVAITPPDPGQITAPDPAAWAQTLMGIGSTPGDSAGPSAPQ